MNAVHKCYDLSMTSIKKFLISGVVAGPLFVIVFLIEQLIRAGYSPMRDPISSLSIGREGWIQMVSFWITGILFLLFAFGVRRTIQRSPGKSFFGPLLLALAGIGFIGAGFCVTDPLPGYPVDLPYHLLPQTTHGQLHNLFSGFVFYGLPIASFVFTRYFYKIGKRKWAIYSFLSGVGALVAFTFVAINIISIVNAEQTASLTQIVGLLQRITIVFIFQWTTLMAVYMLKITPSSSATRSR
jgi:hypothetical protein